MFLLSELVSRSLVLTLSPFLQRNACLHFCIYYSTLYVGDAKTIVATMPYFSLQLFSSLACPRLLTHFGFTAVLAPFLRSNASSPRKYRPCPRNKKKLCIRGFCTLYPKPPTRTLQRATHFRFTWYQVAEDGKFACTKVENQQLHIATCHVVPDPPFQFPIRKMGAVMPKLSRSPLEAEKLFTILQIPTVWTVFMYLKACMK